MKKILLSFVLILPSAFLYAQDAIYKTDDTKIEGKVQEVNVSEIKYKLASNPDGPLYAISKSDVVMIVYQNGSHEMFAGTGKMKFDSLSVNFCRNFIGVDIAEFFSTSVNMTYEHIFGKKGMLAVRLPFSVGLNSRTSFDGYPDGKIFSTGLDFLYFPTGQGEIKYFTAPYFEWGMYRYADNIYVGWEQSSISIVHSNGQHLAGGIKNGLLYQPTRHFCVSADFGFGIKKDETTISNESVEGHFKTNILIGYRF